MLKRIFQLFTIFFIIGCNSSDNQNTTEIIKDSYFFQKNIFNVNLYTCDRPKDDFQISYKSTDNQANFINISECNLQRTVEEYRFYLRYRFYSRTYMIEMVTRFISVF